MTTDVDAVVVGGGFAGVTAARELAGSGLRTVLLEARDRLGGRTWTTRLGDDQVELGGTWVHWHQPHVWSELTRYGIGLDEDDWHYDVALFGNPPHRYDAAYAFAKVRELFAAYAGGQEHALPHPHDPLRRLADVTKLDQLSMADRLDQMDLTSADRDWLSGLLYEIAGSPLDEAGLLGVLRWMALCDWDIDNWYATNRYRPVGGTGRLVDAMLADGRVEVRLSSPVAAVVADEHGVAVTTKGGDCVGARAAIVAVPVNLWPTIDFTPALPAGRLDAARVGVGKPHQSKVWVRVRGEMGRVFGQLPAPAPMNFFWTYAHHGDEQIVMAINANPELRVTDATAVASTLRAYLPEIDEVVDVLGHDWSTDEFSLGGNTCYRTGQLTAHLGELQRPHGRVAFATADIASGWMGYIDGAIESGIRAARDCRQAIAR